MTEARMALADCPFCGEQPRFTDCEEKDDRRYVEKRIVCCLIEMSASLSFGQYKGLTDAQIDHQLRSELTKAWNTRAIAPEATKSAPVLTALYPSGESDPAVTQDRAGADAAQRGEPVAYPSVAAMKSAVELEIEKCLGIVTTQSIGVLIQKAIDASHAAPIAGEPGAMREAVIEECAKIAEKLAEDPAWSPHYKNASIAIADKIRRLAKRAALASAPQPAAEEANQSALSSQRSAVAVAWQEELRYLIEAADDSCYSSEAIGIGFRSRIESLRSLLAPSVPAVEPVTPTPPCGQPVAWRRRRKGIIGDDGWIMCPLKPERDTEFDLQPLYLAPPPAPPVREGLDIVDELRQTAGNLINGIIEDGEVPVGLLSDAADEIERLAALASPLGVEQTDAMREALEDIWALTASYTQYTLDHFARKVRTKVDGALSTQRETGRPEAAKGDRHGG